MKIEELNIRDPFIFPENDYFLITGTFPLLPKGKFYAYKSKDLKNIEGPYILFDGTTTNLDSKEYWAPEIHKLNNMYYLFGTIKPNNMQRGTYVFFSKELFGQYSPIKKDPITPKSWECLDASLFKDEDKLFIVFCREWLEAINGEMYIAEINNDLTKLLEEPKLLFKAHDANWCSPIFGNGYVTDGPFIFKEKGKYHMLWSSFYKENYGLSVIDSDSIYGPYKQEDVPQFDQDEGHGMLFEANNERYLARHCPNHPSGKERIKITKF